MEITFTGGPNAGKVMDVPNPPDAFEFPIYTTNGATNETARYERVKKTLHYEFVGKEKSREEVTAPPQKSVVIRKAKIKIKEKTETEHITKGHMEYDAKKGRYVVKKDE